MKSIRFLFFIFAGLIYADSQSLAQQTEPTKVSEPARYDFGRLSGPWNFSRFPISSLEVSSVSWLDNPAMQFRLEYEDRWRRRSYPESQWIAPPAALLEKFLTRRIIFRLPDPKEQGCHLRFVLHELDQTFENKDSSYVTLEVLASLLPTREGRLLSKRAFFIQIKAPTPDARGGVSATRDACQLLSSEIDDWLTEIWHDSPDIAMRCRSIGRIKIQKHTAQSITRHSSGPAQKAAQAGEFKH